MSWTKLILRTDADHAELLSDALMEQGAISVDIHDAAAGSHNEQPLFGEPGNPSEEIWQDADTRHTFARVWISCDAGIRARLGREYECH